MMACVLVLKFAITEEVTEMVALLLVLSNLVGVVKEVLVLLLQFAQLVATMV